MKKLITITYIIPRLQFISMLWKPRPKCLEGKAKVKYGVAFRDWRYKGKFAFHKITLDFKWKAPCGSYGNFEGICTKCFLKEDIKRGKN